MPKFYAVVTGNYTGIFTEWVGNGNAGNAVSGFPNSIYKKCKSLREAQKFWTSNADTPPPQVDAAGQSSAAAPAVKTAAHHSDITDRSQGDEFSRATSKEEAHFGQSARPRREVADARRYFLGSDTDTLQPGVADARRFFSGLDPPSTKDGAGGANDPDSKHQQPAPAPAPAGPVGSFDDLFTANFERWMSVSVGTDAPYINAPPGPPHVRPVGKYDDIYTSDVFGEVRTTLLPLCSQEARLRLLPDADGEQKLQTVLSKQSEWGARGSCAFEVAIRRRR
jgi:hypothetical protein